jgi:hypothetical protein
MLPYELWGWFFITIKNVIKAGCQWLTPVILATQEAEISRLRVQSQPGQILPENLLWKKKTNRKKGWWSGLRYRPWVQAPVPQEKGQGFYWICKFNCRLNALSSIVIFTLLILPVHEHTRSFHLLVSSSISFLQGLIVLIVEVFYLLS